MNSTSSTGTLVARRLLAQQLAYSALATPRDVVGWLGAIQAQDYAGAKWAVGLRVSERNIGESAVERAIGEGAILRTHVMRWTWQLVLPENVRWMLELVRPRLIARAQRRDRELDLDAATFRKSNAVLDKSLRDGQHRTRSELAALLSHAGISTAEQRLSHLLARAELEAIICSGARRGKQRTYAHLDDRAPKQRTPLARDEALAELARRYFRSRGPALLDDFTWWSGVSATDGRAALESVRPSLEAETIGGRRYFHLDARPTGARPKDVGHLLPAFDEYLVSYRNRDTLLDPRHTQRVNAGGGLLNPAVVVEGRVIGTWRRELVRGAAVIEIDLFQPPSQKEQRAIVKAAARFGSFLDLEILIARISVRGRTVSSNVEVPRQKVAIVRI